MTEPVTYVSLEWIKPLINRLKKIRRKRNETIETIVDIFGDPLHFLKYYVEPNCQHENPADSPLDEPIAVPQGGIFRLLNKFFNREILQHDGASHMIILADAGMGKTSLLLYLRLTQLLSFWPTKYNCFILKLGKDSLENINTISFPHDTILLLDALDEDPESRHRIEERLLELITSTRKFFRVIITCRTKYFPLASYPEYHAKNKIKIGPYECPLVYISLFDDEQVHDYLEKRFPRKLRHIVTSSYNPDYVKAYRVIQMMGSLKFRPLLLSYIDEFRDYDHQGLNEYTIYNILVTKWIDREIQKLYQIDKSYKIEPESLFLGCAIIAVYMHRNDIKKIQETEIDLLKSEAPSLKYLADFDFGGRSLLNRTSDGAYRFAHYSIREFLVAYAIINNKIGAGGKPVNPTDLILQFIFQNISPQVMLKQIDLSGLFFKNKDFSGLNFSGCHLRNTTFDRVKLTGANLTAIEAMGAKFPCCNMNGAKLFNSNLENAMFFETNLSYADLSFANLKQANLTNSILERANLSSTTLSLCNFKGTGVTKYNIKNYMPTEHFISKDKADKNANSEGPIYDDSTYTW